MIFLTAISNTPKIGKTISLELVYEALRIRRYTISIFDTNGQNSDIKDHYPELHRNPENKKIFDFPMKENPEGVIQGFYKMLNSENKGKINLVDLRSEHAENFSRSFYEIQRQAKAHKIKLHFIVPVTLDPQSQNFAKRFLINTKGHSKTILFLIGKSKTTLNDFEKSGFLKDQIIKEALKSQQAFYIHMDDFKSIYGEALNYAQSSIGKIHTKNFSKIPNNASDDEKERLNTLSLVFEPAVKKNLRAWNLAHIEKFIDIFLKSKIKPK